MVYKRYGRRRYRRRRSFRKRSGTFSRRRSYRRSRRVGLGPYLRPRSVTYDRERGKLADRLFTIQDWSVDWLESSLLGGEAAYSFRGNSTYDPDPTVFTTSAEKQQMLSTRYSRYLVLGCKYILDVVPKYPGPYPLAQTLEVTIWPQIPSSIGASSTWEGHRYMRRCIAPKLDTRYRLKGYMSTKTIMGVKNPLDRAELSAIASQNPTSVWHWCMGIRNVHQSILDCHCFLKMRFYVVWYQPKPVEEL